MSKVTKIEQISIAPIPLPKPSIRKVAAYARVSTDRGEQLNSLEAQKDYYEKKIEELHPEFHWGQKSIVELPQLLRF